MCSTRSAWRRLTKEEAMRDRMIYPLPELIDPGRWVIQHLDRGGWATRSPRYFAAPLVETAMARAVRAHELAHVCFSPPKPEPRRYRVRATTLLAVEDGRVNERLWRIGFGDVLHHLHDPSLPPPDPERDLREATLILVAAHRSGAFARYSTEVVMRGAAGQRACELAARAIAAFAEPADPPGFEVTVEVARMLDRALGPPTTGSKRAGCVAARLVHGGRRGPADRRSGAGSASGGSRWGALREVEEPARPVPCGRGSGFVLRATDEGTMLRAPYRLLVDGRVFARRRRASGGTVLIDASGSMRLTPDDLARFIGAAPAAQVACYDGCDDWGALRVLARHGRRVEDAFLGPPAGRGGNVVDGPALRWLAAQPSPRIWVSDGLVTGVGDASAPDLVEETGRICSAADIRRVRHVHDVPAALRAARRM
jgi:hypothetical protein